MKSLLTITSIIAINQLPVRKNGKLLSNTINLLSDNEIGAYAELKNGYHVFFVTINNPDFPITDLKERPVTLHGRINSSEEILFSSDKFSLSKNDELSFSVVINKTPNGFLFIKEAIRWEIFIPDTDTHLEVESTELSLCFLPKTPLDASKGIAIESLYMTNEALSKLSNDNSSINGDFISRAGYSDPLNDVASITQWMFSRSPKAIYDTYQGAPHFSWGPFNSIILNYTGIMTATTSQRCNCYDMAAFLQYQVQYSVGIEVYFDYIKPFGYLKLTNLIGWGPCNNPFFKNPDYNSSQVCTNDDKPLPRSCFGNHAFIYLPDYGVVADACSGPHTGNESKRQYLTNSIDKNTPTPPSIWPGTVNDIVNYRGVIHVTTSLKASTVMNQYNLLAFIESVKLNSTALKKELLVFNNNFDIRECPQIGNNLALFEDELHSDFPFVIRQISLSDGGSKSINFKIYVASNSTEPALDQYLSLGANHEMSAPIFVKGAEYLGESSGKFEAADYSRYIWLSQNMVFDFKATNFSKEDVENILSWISKNVSQKIELLKENTLPLINEIKLSNKSVKVGDHIHIEIDCSSELRLFIEGDHPGLYIQTEQVDSFSFLAKKSSINNFQICAVNPISLVSIKKDITIIVE